MTTDTAKKAKQKRAQFSALLAEYDSDVVAQVRDAIEESTIAHTKDANLSVEEWLEFLENVGTDAYLFAMDTNYTGHGEARKTEWYLRHDGDAFVYGTGNTGELYRGDNAEQQIQAVIENYRVIPTPMSEYPLRSANGGVENQRAE
ncbi:hypothetical protein [Halorientalis regularis]|uniref:Uncharacterized protein n=1 Tax=Halorientalis regularis TaxID=660518 RepID=A0A1G7TC20_9EURY|nr:hypothetical protein [Halorientalis regularis]SDG32927.1 hypothetical protein SAMN05216218_12443 [Halorientalis regularis]